VEGGGSTGQIEERNDDWNEHGVASTTLPKHRLDLSEIVFMPHGHFTIKTTLHFFTHISARAQK